MPDQVVEFVVQGVSLEGKLFRIMANGMRCVVLDVRLEQLEPIGRVAARTKLAEVQRVTSDS